MHVAIYGLKMVVTWRIYYVIKGKEKNRYID